MPRFELYGPNKVHTTPGGYYNLDEDNSTERMIVKLHLLEALISQVAEEIMDTSEIPKDTVLSKPIMKLADQLFKTYQDKIEKGDKKFFEQKNPFSSKHIKKKGMER